jgi:hypothetical protein
MQKEQLTKIKINQLKKLKEQYFLLNPLSKEIFYVNHYSREYKEYSISKVNDMNFEKFVKSNKTVYIGFIY